MLVMAGLDPAIHVFGAAKEDVDARHKAGHDEVWFIGAPLLSSFHYTGSVATFFGLGRGSVEGCSGTSIST